MNYSEEEKEVIEQVKEELKRVHKINHLSGTYVPIDYLEIILNLIQKQEEEIKRLKEDVSNMYDEKVVRNILEDECGLSKYEIDEILN